MAASTLRDSDASQMQRVSEASDALPEVQSHDELAAIEEE